MDLSRSFSPREIELLDEIRALDSLPSEVEAIFSKLCSVLDHLAIALETCPDIRSPETIAGRTRSVESLIERLATSDPSSLDFLLPTRAVLGQAFLHAKINFLKALRFILEERPDAAGLTERLNDVLGDSLYFRLTEELLIGCISNAENAVELKRAAAQVLIPMWTQRQSIPIQDFTSLLLSAWRARRRVHEVFGTLVGFHEVLALLRAECEPRFLDFFNREFGTTDELDALREFLFGVSFEDLQTISRYMEEHDVQNVNRDDVAKILGKPVFQTSFDSSPEAVYLSYRRRRVRADYRVLTGQSGPRKTAEGYLMQYLLLRKD